MSFYVPAWLDDLGLTPTEFRVICHICRRANGLKGGCTASISSMAEACQMKRHTVSSIIGRLERRNLIERKGKVITMVKTGPQTANSENQNWSPNGQNESEEKIETGPQTANNWSPNGQQLVPKRPQRKPIKETLEGKEEGDLFGGLPFPTVEFSQAWEGWKSYRIEIRKKLSPSTEKAQLKSLSKLKENEAIATINASIEKGWTGLFPDKFSSQSGSRGSGNHHLGATNQGRTFRRRTGISASGEHEDF